MFQVWGHRQVSAADPDALLRQPPGALLVDWEQLYAKHNWTPPWAGQEERLGWRKAEDD